MSYRTCRRRRSSASGRFSLSGLLSNLCQKGQAIMPGPFSLLYFPRKCRGFNSALGRTRACDLLIRSLNWQVLLGSSLLANSLYSGRKRSFALCVFPVLFGSVLSLLLPHCCQEIYISGFGP